MHVRFSPSLLTFSILLTGLLGGCSTSSPTQADIDNAAEGEDYWRARYERQCINSGVKPGSPGLVKCVDDLMDIRAE